MTEFQFTNRDWIFIAGGLLLALAAIILFSRKKYGFAILALTACGFLFRVVMITVDPFVSQWDEQYHALVAKNMAEHFFTPTLVDHPLQSTNPEGWAYTDVWLHKPPLFLWQMAVAIKLLGAKFWVIRIPSLLLSTLVIPAIYRMGKIVANERTGFIAATLITFSFILVYTVSGFLNTDHNDVTFAAYVCFSFWAWLEYMNAPTKKWIVLVGVFAGAAVLTKWLPGMMVFGAWGIALLFIKDNRMNFIKWKHLIAAFIVCIIVAAPWFIYASVEWPVESSAAMSHYSSHFNDDQGHPGPWWFHLNELAKQNGLLFALLSGISLIFFALSNVRREIKSGLVFVVLFVYAFYSMIPARMPLFCLPLLPLVILIIAFGINRMMEGMQGSRWNKAAGIVLCAGLILAQTFITRSELYNGMPDVYADYRKTRSYNKVVFETFLKGVPENSVVFNCSMWNAVPCMFYANCTAYDQAPDETQIAEAKTQGRPVYVFDDGALPEWIAADASINIIREPLIRNGY